MICYMPFTHIEEPQLRQLSGLFGTITIYSPAEAMLPGRMRQWAQQEALEIRYPETVEGPRVISLVEEYKAWADIHQGNIGDIAGFLKSRPERFAMMEETNPSQIRHQVRHFGDPPVRESADPLLDAALFLSLAQEFDRQQYAMDREMDAVQALERRMMKQISGDDTDIKETMPMGTASEVSSRDQTISPDMIPQRVCAWALLALEAGDPAFLYLTPSRPVVDHILDLFPDGMETYHQPLGSVGNEPSIPPARLREMVQAINLDPDSVSIEGRADTDDPLPGSDLRLTMYRFSNLTPRTFLETLSGKESAAESLERQVDGPSHTMIGIVTADTQ